MDDSWWKRRLVLLILCVLQPLLLPVSRGCFPEERAALLEIRASLLRANPTVPPPRWGEAGDDCCRWKRVRCSGGSVASGTPRRVSHLFLSDMYRAPNGSGSWSLDVTVLAAFPELQVLNLSNNGLTLLNFDGFKNLSNLRELHLSSNNISGNLPPFLFSMPHIELLNLSKNMFEGQIPVSSSSNISLSLRSLRLSHNNLSGRFSFFWFKKLINLVEIDLSGNANLAVSVNIPGWVPRFQLRHLHLSGCDLDKNIITKPTFLGTQHHLEDLDLSNNNLFGAIPNWLFTKRSTLVNLNLRNNSLIGSLDPIWHPQTSLQFIDVSMNHIVGQLPTNISSVFPSMIRIDVSNNNFSGEIPMSLCHINHTRVVLLYNNKFSGEIPSCIFTDLPNLRVLRVSNNHLGGPILGGRNNLSIRFAMHLDGNKFEGALPRNLSGELLIMDLHDNKLTGELDVSSWNLSSLQILDVANNYMTGEIQPQLCALSSIQYLDLSNNNFTGRIRCHNNASLVYFNASMNSLSGHFSWDHFNMPNLFNLDVRHNMLTGDLSWVHRFDNMTMLFLGHNKFYGQIPPSLCKLRYLRIIDLSYNKLSGTVPPCIGAMPFQDNALFIKIFQSLVFVCVNTWKAEGAFTFGTKGMQLTYGPNVDLMSGIDLSGNSLSGEIPQELGKLNHVKSLNLSHNTLVGIIPPSLANMSEVESLDLSYNKLTGVIPMELTQLQSLEVFNVTYNHLSGCVPSFGQFGTFGMESYTGNNLDLECSSPPASFELGPIMPHDEVLVDAGSYVIGATSFVLGFWATIFFSFCHSTGRGMIVEL